MKDQILTDRQNLVIETARRNAGGKLISVDRHVRMNRYLPPASEAAALARWQKVEQAVFVACSAADRHGVYSRDKILARRVISLLQDTFGV